MGKSLVKAGCACDIGEFCPKCCRDFREVSIEQENKDLHTRNKTYAKLLRKVLRLNHDYGASIPCENDRCPWCLLLKEIKKELAKAKYK